jgi:hypothetical protein
MNVLSIISGFLKKYLPVFFLVAFSGNPIFTGMGYSQNLLIGYTLLILIFTLFIIDLQTLKKILGIVIGLFTFIVLLTFLQKIILGFVSLPGVIKYAISIVLGLTTIIYYKNKKIDFVDTFIKLIAFLALLSIPFWIVNQFTFLGIATESISRKSLLFYTSFRLIPGRLIVRNSGMFWEPGAFAGYLILALVFIALKNRKFEIGPYKKEVFSIFIVLLTTVSTTGFVILGIILVIHSLQNYRWGKIVIVPVSFLIIYFAYYKLEFLQEKIEHQYANAVEMRENDVSNTRFGALKMDWQYIKAQPLIGNGLHVKTRYRFHPQVKGDIGHGNGMSNFLASWGIPFFLFWIFCVFKFTIKTSRSIFTSLSAVFVIILLLQGEPFLNFPLFLAFFILPFVYNNILSFKNKIHLIETHFGKKIKLISKT